MMTSSGREVHVTEKGRSYQATQKRKVYGQLLKKLKSSGSLIVESVEQGEIDRARKDFDAWKHDYVDFVQTFDMLCSLLDDIEKKDAKEKHAVKL